MAEVTGAPPPALASKPEVLPGLGSYLEAFGVLCGSRGEGFSGPPPIRLSEMESYCRLTGWRDLEAVAELVEIVQALDTVYLDVVTRRDLGDEADARAAKQADYPVWAGHGNRIKTAWPEGEGIRNRTANRPSGCAPGSP